MNTAVIVIRPVVNMSLLRESMKVFLSRDLTTNTKGSGEQLALLSLMIGMDEYNNCRFAMRLLDYTIMCVVNNWTIDSLRNIFLNVSYSMETVNQNTSIVFLKGSLEVFSDVIKNFSKEETCDDILEILNNIQQSFESDGQARAFSDTVKERKGRFFFLRRK